MLKACVVALGSLLMSCSATADWMKVFSAHDFPLSVLPGAVNAAMSCKVAGPKSLAAAPVDDLELLKAWIAESHRDEATPVWAADWSKRLEPLAMYLGRVSSVPSGEYAYGPVPEGAAPLLRRTTQSDAVAVDVAIGFASWALQPSRMIDGESGGGYAPLVKFESDASPILNKVWAATFVSRLPYDGIDTRAGRDAAATFEVFHSLLFGDPVFVQPPPSLDSIRRFLVNRHGRTVAELQRFKDGTGEFRRWKTLEDVVQSLDRPEMGAGFEALKRQEEDRLKAGLIESVRSSLPSSTVVGLSAYPSTSELPGVARAVSPHPDKCGVTALEAKAIEMIGQLAYVQARLGVTRELSSGPLSFTDSGFGIGAAGLDADAKELMRAFFPLAVASIARRTAYEFFWAFTYKIERERKSGNVHVSPFVLDSDTADTRRAKEEAAKLLNRISRIANQGAGRFRSASR